MSEALRALGVLAEPPCAEHAAIAEVLALPPPPSADEHVDVLGFQLPPYASIYLGAEGMLGGEARDRIAGFWRALGAQPPHEPDHLSVLCAALAQLVEADRPTDAPLGAPADAERRTRPLQVPGVAGPADPAEAESGVRPGLAGPADGERRARDPRVRTALAALYWEHIASWTPPYLAALRRVGSPFYAAWADTLDAVLAAEAEAVGPPPELPLALRAVPAPAEPPADLAALLGVVLAPVRIGMVVARDDLACCAAALGLGLRAGERRFALRALLAQDAAGVLRWLAGEARQQADAYGDRSPIARWWRGRAGRTARWLDGLARDAADRTQATPA